MGWILRNVAGRPVEIHGPSGVIVLAPFADLAVEEIDPQCLALERRGVLARRAAPAAAEEPAAPPAETTAEGEPE